MLKVLVSGCLGGRPIRFNQTGVDVSSAVGDRWVREGRLVHFCPELAVGFGVPRPPAEIVGGTAVDALSGDARVLENTGADVTDLFRMAAQQAVDRARAAGAAMAVLVNGSPTCGTSNVYDGSFTGQRIPGRGLAAELLQRSGIPVFSESELDLAAALLERLESQAPAS